MSDRVFDPDEAAQYYDDTSTAEFYETGWGGEDIHIGLYATGQESVAEASAAMTRHLSLIHISEPTRLNSTSRMPSSA